MDHYSSRQESYSPINYSSGPGGSYSGPAYASSKDSGGASCCGKDANVCIREH